MASSGSAPPRSTPLPAQPYRTRTQEGAPRKSPKLHFVPIQQHRLTANSFQSPYFYRASGLAQIAVSALLRISSLDARQVLAAEHCRYGTRDFAIIEITAGLNGFTGTKVS
jgi:hypothetical protein